jgi:hypothetical protein
MGRNGKNKWRKLDLKELLDLPNETNKSNRKWRNNKIFQNSENVPDLGDSQDTIHSIDPQEQPATPIFAVQLQPSKTNQPSIVDDNAVIKSLTRPDPTEGLTPPALAPLAASNEHEVVVKDKGKARLAPQYTPPMEPEPYPQNADPFERLHLRSTHPLNPYAAIQFPRNSYARPDTLSRTEAFQFF